MSKITFLAEKCWIIRAPSVNNPKVWNYHVVANQWNRSPAFATIYSSEENAQRFIEEMRHYGRVGFAIKDRVEAVPLHGALLTSGKQVVVRKD